MLPTRRFKFSYLVRSDGGLEQRSVVVPVEVRSRGRPSPSPFPGPRPVLVFSAGFLTQPSAYGRLIDGLVDAGCAVVTYGTTFESLSAPLDDLDHARLLLSVWREAEAAQAESNLAPGSLFLVGHSRGAKLSVLAAAQAAAEGGTSTQGSSRPQLPDPPAGLILLDPADGSFEPQDPARFPSALAVLRAAQAETEASGQDADTRARDTSVSGAAQGPGRVQSLGGLPVLVLGAARGVDCVPKAKGAKAFFQATPGPSALVTLADAGHMQFADRSDGLLQSVCATGRARHEDIADTSAALTAAFAWGVAGALEAARAEAEALAQAEAAMLGASAPGRDGRGQAGQSQGKGKDGGGAAGVEEEGGVEVRARVGREELRRWCKGALRDSVLRTELAVAEAG
ncbi:hypothetical protein HYH03_004250 [Edaphochlamys debaryana]|uniref:Chlorophyllase n=1 Tax=Edaphochlamys debaryana TaxID=47281 RepID=A0A835YBW8_9CHLO|nr:hypothetical protein HYH03_004250 [Edaphochlamys debaryana]|eukprot:KAG2497991.1 hypothetical protein HYH03_004250 [Edaphochlamys debaryana]